MIVRASLAAATMPARDAGPAAPAFLDEAGADLVLGTRPDPDGLAAPIAPRADTLFAPRAACLAAPDGPLYVSDTGHHRLLGWRRRPTVDHQPADLVVGQPDFVTEGRNARGEIDGATLNVPTGVACEDGVLAVADAWNHRVLLWYGSPEGRPADVVLGQEGPRAGAANRGSDRPAADTLHWCYGVTLAGGRLFVADSGNRRVLVWERVPERDGAPADFVLGQSDFDVRDENAGAAASAMSMRWPHAVAWLGDDLLVADAGNSRVMAWRGMPRANGRPCDLVLGQKDFASADHNRAAYGPTAAALNMPYGVCSFAGAVVVADTANSRLVGWGSEGLATGAPADLLAGQRRFGDKGDNRWGPATRDSLCWPYGVAGLGDTLVIADSGNNRVLLWKRKGRE